MSSIASPAKLKDGSWGARVPGTATTGQTITVRAANGKTWTAVVDRVLWTGTSNGERVSLCSTRPREAGTRTTGRGTNPRAHTPNGKRCRACGGAMMHAPHHRSMHGYCGACAFDEFDC